MYPAAALYGSPLLFASVGIISYLCGMIAICGDFIRTF